MAGMGEDGLAWLIGGLAVLGLAGMGAAYRVALGGHLWRWLRKG